MGSTIGFEMSLIVIESIQGQCANFMILTATVSVSDKLIYFSSIYFVCVITVQEVCQATLHGGQHERVHDRNTE